MADRNFEVHLDRLFDQSPGFADADLFAVRVNDRLDRGWSMRRLLIGGLGTVGGLIGVYQVLGSGLVAHLHTLVAQSGVIQTVGLKVLDVQQVFPEGLQGNGEVLAMSAALAVTALALTLVRVVREI